MYAASAVSLGSEGHLDFMTATTDLGIPASLLVTSHFQALVYRAFSPNDASFARTPCAVLLAALISFLDDAVPQMKHRPHCEVPPVGR